MVAVPNSVHILVEEEVLVAAVAAVATIVTDLVVAELAGVDDRNYSERNDCGPVDEIATMNSMSESGLVEAVVVVGLVVAAVVVVIVLVVVVEAAAVVVVVLPVPTYTVVAVDSVESLTSAYRHTGRTYRDVSILVAVAVVVVDDALDASDHRTYCADHLCFVRVANDSRTDAHRSRESVPAYDQWVVVVGHRFHCSHRRPPAIYSSVHYSLFLRRPDYRRYGGGRHDYCNFATHFYYFQHFRFASFSIRLMYFHWWLAVAVVGYRLCFQFVVAPF